MPQQLDLSAVASQQITSQLVGRFYELTIKEANGCMAITVLRDNVTLVSGQRMVAGTPILPYEYQEDGNFIMLTANDDLPDWRQFGQTQFLIFLTQAELDAA